MYEGSVAITVVPEGESIIEVVEPDEATTNALEAVLMSSVSVMVYDAGSMGTQMQASVRDSNGLVVPVVGRVLGVWQGRRFALGQTVLRGQEQGNAFSFSWSDGVGPPPEDFTDDTIDLVIVPDVEVALKTPDVTRLYGGELSVPEVTVKWQVPKGEVEAPSGWVGAITGLNKAMNAAAQSTDDAENDDEVSP